MKIFLGIDGGQSHTTAIVADRMGNILGKGVAGPSNHTLAPGGRKRLISSIESSAGEALKLAGLSKKRAIAGFKFSSAHLAMTGEPEYKTGIIKEILSAERLVVGHDAPAALAGAIPEGNGVIVLAGTGSVAYGEVFSRGKRKTARIGGHGYLFGDKGSGFDIARTALGCALYLEDGGLAASYKKALLSYFNKPSLKDIAQAVYRGEITRDHLASFSSKIDVMAERNDKSSIELIDSAAVRLSALAMMTANKLRMEDKRLTFSYGGGVFSSSRLISRFSEEILAELPLAEINPPRFEPGIGALLLSYRQAGIEADDELLAGIARSCKFQ